MPVDPQSRPRRFWAVRAHQYKFPCFIKAPAAHSAAGASRHPGLRSCLYPAPALPPLGLTPDGPAM